MAEPTVGHLASSPNYVVLYIFLRIFPHVQSHWNKTVVNLGFTDPVTGVTWQSNLPATAIHRWNRSGFYEEGYLQLRRSTIGDKHVPALEHHSRTRRNKRLRARDDVGPHHEHFISLSSNKLTRRVGRQIPDLSLSRIRYCSSRLHEINRWTHAGKLFVPIGTGFAAYMTANAESVIDVPVCCIIGTNLNGVARP